MKFVSIRIDMYGCPGNSRFCAYAMRRLGIPIPTSGVPVARGVYYRGRFQELALSSGTAHDVVMVPTHCLVLVDFIALYIYLFVLHILCVIVTFTYVQ